jgi:hypothetical protein
MPSVASFRSASKCAWNRPRLWQILALLVILIPAKGFTQQTVPKSSDVRKPPKISPLLQEAEELLQRGNKQNWIKIKLIGTACNRTAIGARVRVVTGKHAQTDEVHSGTSVLSQGDLRLHFGIGKSQKVDLLEVKWPTTQKLEKFTDVGANQILAIREGSGIVAAVKPQIK